jgi:hypothetical protein
MKTCPSCRLTYDDDTLVFCLQDGARLLSETKAVDPEATLQLPQLPPTQAAPRITSPQQSTITGRPEQFLINPSQFSSADRDEPRKSGYGALPWVLAIVVVLGVSSVLIALIVTRGLSDKSAKSSAPMASPSAVPVASPAEETVTKTSSPATTTEKTAKPTPAPPLERPKPAFSVLNNISFNGSRITYYPRSSFGQCQADCAANANCKGLTWIRPGAYNPGDSAMCYLMAAVTDRISHSCCISAVRN